jgi:hypothetical protein
MPCHRPLHALGLAELDPGAVALGRIDAVLC